MLLVIIVVSFFGLVRGQLIPENPCPDIFTYRQHEGIYYGDVVVPYDGSKSMNLAVNISMLGLYQNVKLKLDLLTPADQILSSPVLRYRVNFPFQNVIPRITQIAYNGRVLCYGPSEPVSIRGVTNLWANIVYKINEFTYTIQDGFKNPPNPFINNVNDFIEPSRPPPATSPPPKPSPENNCGISNDLQTLVLKGDNTIENEYPWLVALLRRQKSSNEFQCTSNLISNRHVITAAHCVMYYKAPLIDKEDIFLVLGRWDISHWTATDALIRTALEVIPHPNYQEGSGHCDIAIIKMNEEVTFRPTVRPVCLWEGDSNIKRIDGTKGVVAGWGKTEDQKVAGMPNKISMPVVKQETCLWSHPGFKNLTSEMTFCAGNRDGSGPCSGDSGAGFIIKKDRRWFLRGVVSRALQKEDYTCNLDEYIVFADVAKLKEWIMSVVK